MVIRIIGNYRYILDIDYLTKCKVMKQGLLIISVFSFIIFTSCEKDAEPEPYSLAIDLQNGYWERHFGPEVIIILKFNTSTFTSYWIWGTPPCIDDTSTQGYTLNDSIMKYEDYPDPITVEIQGDILTIDPEGYGGTFERKSTLDYPDCE